MAAQEAEYFKSDVPEGRSGEWVVEKFEVRGEGEWDPDRTDLPPDCARRRPGRYTRLRKASTTFMSDLYDEWWTQRIAIQEACRRAGHVLVTGLGLGLIVESIFRYPGCPVVQLTVVESSSDVLRLVGSHLERRYSGQLRLVQADAFTWEPPPGSRFSVVWHDIWPNPHDPGVFSEMEQLEKRYHSCCQWQGCWPHEYLRVYKQTSRAKESGSIRSART